MCSFTTDFTTDDVNKNSYMNFTVFWITEDYELCHAMYKCEYFEQRHTGYNIKQAIESILSELNLNIYDTPCTTDKGANIIAATSDKTHVDCLCQVKYRYRFSMESNSSTGRGDNASRSILSRID